MKKLVISLFLALTLIVIMAVPAMADIQESTETASVTVTSYASVTIEDQGSDGLNFSSLAPGSSGPEAETPAIRVYTGEENNVIVTISVKGTDFSDGGTESFGIGNASWNTTNNEVGATSMITDYAVVGGLGADGELHIYHWLSIPGEQAAGAYQSTFTYKSEY